MLAWSVYIRHMGVLMSRGNNIYAGATSLQARLLGLGLAAALGLGSVALVPAVAMAEDLDPQVASPDEAQAAVETPLEVTEDDAARDAVQPVSDGPELAGDPEPDGELGDGNEAQDEVQADEVAAVTAPSPADAPEMLPADGSAVVPTVTPDEVPDSEPVPAEAADANDDASANSQAGEAEPIPEPLPAKVAEEGEQSGETPAPPIDGWWTDPNDASKTYFYKNGVQQRGWVVTTLGVADNKAGASKRYWLDSSYVLARGRVVNPAASRDKLSGAYLAYATDDGSIATGVYRVGDRIYLANSKGKLGTLKGSKKRGWLVTKTYDGTKRRYYLYRSTSGADKGAYYAQYGFSRDDYAHYTLSKGYVLTGIKRTKGRIYIANDKGKMAAPSKDRKRGWLVTSEFAKGDEKKRYYLYRDTDSSLAGGYYAKRGYSSDGYRHFTKPSSGYVVTGRWKKGERVYLATSKGKLASLKGGKDQGWLTSSSFGQGKRRYYLYRSTAGSSKGAYYAKIGLSSDGYRHYTTKRGYVLANEDIKIDNQWYIANEKGKLKKSELPSYLVRANNYSSPSQYLLLVDTGHSRVYVCKGGQGHWSVIKNWPCSCGGSWSPTVKGVFHVGSKGYSFGHGYTCYYWTQIYSDYLFHSIKYYEGTFRVKDGTLGNNVSMGCVRLQIDNAKWIHDVIPSGTTIVSW